MRKWHLYILLLFQVCDSGSSRIVKISGQSIAWQKCSAGTSGAQCNQGFSKIYTWPEAKKYCQNLDLGSAKWQLPRITDMLTLRKCKEAKKINFLVSKKQCLNSIPKSEKKSCAEISKVCAEDEEGYAAIDRNLFPSTELSGFWTASGARNNKERAWGLSFDSGYIQTAEKSNKLFVRCLSTIKE